tara:strand:+ start:384 stop:680 length:297 start_codon:yes stop_codon:yes gene_type:complete
MNKNDNPFRVSNFFWGCSVGAFVATVAFAVGFIISENKSSIPITNETLQEFIEYVHWGWFAASVIFFGIWGFLLNNRIGETISDILYWFDFFGLFDRK